jgi:FtsP/CotA-like multicopper oxidase with cupredoxin domain
MEFNPLPQIVKKLIFFNRIQVKVTNNLTDEGTTLHWHGLLQSGTAYFDGVPAVSQCPIPPGGTLVYTFRASLYGTSWYHCKFKFQFYYFSYLTRL